MINYIKVPSNTGDHNKDTLAMEWFLGVVTEEGESPPVLIYGPETGKVLPVEALSCVDLVEVSGSSHFNSLEQALQYAQDNTDSIFLVGDDHTITAEAVHKNIIDRLYVFHTLERDKMLDIVPLKTYLYSKLRFHGSNMEEPSLGISLFSRGFESVLTQVPKKLLPRVRVLL